jgi:uncharacterized membrane protein
LIFLLSRWSGGLVARYGARTPLIAGSVLTALGFVLFATLPVGFGYWKTLFPAIVMLGIGMAVTVAPLTTVVMNSVNQDRVGVASGTNNAVARAAGVLAIAVLGIVMVNVFASRLDHDLAQLSLPPDSLQEIHAGQTRLAGLQVPATLDSGTQRAIREAIGDAFILAFKKVMWVSAGLCLASATIARLMIGTSLRDA